VLVAEEPVAAVAVDATVAAVMVPLWQVLAARDARAAAAVAASRRTNPTSPPNALAVLCRRRKRTRWSLTLASRLFRNVGVQIFAHLCRLIYLKN